MLGLASICGTVYLLHSQKNNIEMWGWEGGEMDDLKDCNYVQVSQLFLSKIVDTEYEKSYGISKY